MTAQQPFLHPTQSSQTSQAPQHIEPGLLSVFRLVVGVELALQSLAVFFLASSHTLGFNADSFLIWTQLLALFIYLFAGRAQRMLHGAYLPLALWVASVGPVLSEAAGTAARIGQGIHGKSALVDPTNLYVWLLLPLVLISAQYRRRILLLFTAGTSLLSTVLLAFLASSGGFGMTTVVGDAIARFVLFTAAGLIIVQLSKAQRAYRIQQTVQREQLARYALTLEQLTISRERNRLAREMHDTLAHTLSAISVQLTAIDAVWTADPENAHQMLRQTQELTRAGLDEARRALHELRASPVATLGLIPALRQTAERAAARGGFALSFSAPQVNFSLAPEVEQQLYRIVEEATANIARHAHATHAWVTLAFEEYRPRRLTLTTLRRGRRALILTVRDDGVGFDTAKPPPAGHFGLAGISERAMLLNATIELASAPGAGTLLRLTLPL